MAIETSQIRSLGYRTDLFFLVHQGQVEDRGGYLVARSPTNPGYFWGNLLFFPAPPEEEDRRRWPALFRQEFQDSLEVRHMTFGWDCPEGSAGAGPGFVEDGFRFELTDVLAADRVLPPSRPCLDVEVRPLAGPAEWCAAVENQVACRDDHFEEAPYRRFATRRMDDYRGIVEAGQGDWMGAFLGGVLVADCGIFVDGDVGRFQAVGTHPDFRRRGVCTSMVFAACRRALDDLGARTLVIAAEPEEQAGRIYRSLGFRQVERQAGLCRWPSPTEPGTPIRT